MKMHVHNPGKNVVYMQLHTMPPDGFVMWSEEDKQAWYAEQLKKSPAVAIAPGFNGEVDLPTSDLSTGIAFTQQ
jgi:hypothetical protein